VFSYLNNRRTKLIKACKEAGYEFYSFNDDPSFFNSSVIDGGLLIVSRFPIKESIFLPYKTAAV